MTVERVRPAAGTIGDVHQTESVVLLDERGAAVGTAAKATVHHRNTPLHLAFSCYLIDAEGRVVLTQRALHKATWPGVWTNSCCGHPGPDEPIVDAVRRRLRDELGTSVHEIDLILPTFRYRAVMDNGIVENEMCPVFRARTATDLAPDPHEVADAAWHPWPEVAATISANGSATAPWFRRQVAELGRLGSDPHRWPTGDDAALPAAARHRQRRGSRPASGSIHVP